MLGEEKYCIASKMCPKEKPFHYTVSIAVETPSNWLEHPYSPYRFF